MKEFLGKSLSEEQMMRAMTQIMEGRAPEEDMEAFLRGMSERGESVDELTGAARVLRQKARTIRAPEDALDCCGTGGDVSGTYNISTAVAFVAAACGVPIAKHGNRASSSKSGAADVLAALGVKIDLENIRLEEALRRYNFTFLMAPLHHEAVQHVMNVRKKIGRRTIFNLLGPLANPADTKYQLLGVFDRKWLRPMAETLKRLGTKRAWLVHGADGLDEISTTGPTYVVALDKDGSINERTLAPEDFGLIPANPMSLKGGTAQENAKALRGVLEGQKGAYRDIVLANAAAALCVHGSAKDLKKGMNKAAEALDGGRALKILEDYIEFSNRP